MSQSNKELHQWMWDRIKKDVAEISVPQVESRGYKLVKNEIKLLPGKQRAKKISYVWKHVCWVDGRHQVISYIYANINTSYEEVDKLPESVVIKTQDVLSVPSYAVRAAIKHIEQWKPTMPSEQRLQKR